MFKAIIFDMDGLMIDSEKLYMKAEGEIAESYGKTVTQETMYKMMGRGTLESLQIFKDDLNLPLPVEELVRLREKKMLELFRNETEPMKGLFDIIAAFYEKFQLAIATGSTQILADIAVDQLKIREKFALIQSSEKLSKGKPDPEIYLTVTTKLGCKPGECIVLEDSENGIKAGKAAGCYVIGVPNEHTINHDLSQADAIAGSLTEAIKLIENL